MVYIKNREGEVICTNLEGFWPGFYYKVEGDNSSISIDMNKQECTVDDLRELSKIFNQMANILEYVKGDNHG